MLRPDFDNLIRRNVLGALNLDWLTDDQREMLHDDLWETIGKRWTDEQIRGVLDTFRRECTLRITRGMNYTAALAKALHEARKAWLDRHPAKKAPQSRNAQENQCPNNCRFGWLEVRVPGEPYRVVPCRHCMPGNPRARNRNEIEGTTAQARDVERAAAGGGDEQGTLVDW
ncbi:hypothetical protein [Oceanidesulfovibrio marinus]|uniref:Uncharacterized protein n=1 Tax=Oceanidesulfovibrio marinus TaxID=370038 RepID=A0A6P1ZJA4_9BACT|nr:hypothetical protein [Oceanidesulfovibrio marinus]TVM35626.1 hypothetical protein DQK91_02880 [Oceanidesulfovibrio marinus]